MSTREWFFSFCLDLELFTKKKKDLVSTYTLTETMIINNSRSKKKLKKKKNLEHPFVDIVK